MSNLGIDATKNEKSEFVTCKVYVGLDFDL